MKKLKFIFTFLFLATGLAISNGCAPKKENRDFKDTRFEIQPRQQDTALDLTLLKSATALSLKIPDIILSSDLLALAEQAILLGESNDRSDIRKFGTDIVDSFYGNPNNTSQVQFSQSPYLQAAVGETEGYVRTEIKNGFVLLQQSQDKILSYLRQSAENYPWPLNPVPMREAYSFLKVYLETFQRWVNTSDLDPRVQEAFAIELRNQVAVLDDLLPRQIEKIEKATDLRGVLVPLKETIQKLGFVLDDKQEESLRWGLLVDKKLKDIQTSNDALSLLVFIWKELSPSDQEKVFSPMPEFHDFLLKRKPRQIECLISGLCVSPYLELAKTFRIFPAIKKYGIEKLKKEITAAAYKEAIEQISIQVKNLVRGLPILISQKVTASFDEQRLILGRIDIDFVSFINSAASKWAYENLGGNPRLRGAEAPRVHLQMTADHIIVENADPGPIKEVYAQSIGASWAALVSYWNSREQDQSLSVESLSRSILEQINKLLAVGGFKMKDGELYPSFATTVTGDNAGQTRLDLRAVYKAKEVFAVPDRVQIHSGLNKKYGALELNVSADSQSEMLRGLSKMICFLRDWETNSYNRTLGKVMVSDLDLDIPTKGLKQKMFPKETMYTLSVANAAVILTNIVKDLSPVFLLNPESKLVWANEFGNVQFDNATMAGVVDLVNGKRTETVNTKSVARYIIALVAFVKATEGLEKTSSSLLQEKDADGKSIVSQIMEARQKLRLLVLGLANFIARQVTSEDGGVYGHFNLLDRKASTGIPRELSDQVWAIKALLAAHELLGMSLFKAAALDTYYFMNKKLYRDSLGFYSINDQQVEIPDIIELGYTLTTLSEIKELLTGDSRKQAIFLISSWLKPLRKN